MAANTGTVKIRFEVDDQGSVKITQLGKKAKETGDQVENSFRRGGKSLSDFNNTASNTVGHIRQIAFDLAKLYAVMKTAQFVKDSALMAARYETLGIVMNTVGKTAGYTRDELDKQAKTLEKLGISITSARESTIKSIQAGIGFNESLKLARIAQDAAVIGNINSSQAFEQMIYGIQTAQIEVLKTIGLNVNFEQSYARLSKELGKNTDQLTDQEKLQARLNAVFAEGSKIVGVYESAMSTAGKKLTSFSRYVDDFKVKMGNAFGPAVTKLVDDATIAMKRYTEEVTRPEAQKGLMDFALGLERIASAAIDLSKKMATLVQYANLRSVMGTVAEGMALVDKGVLDREAFIKASFVERQKMVDDYAQKVKNSSGVIRMAINEETEGYADYVRQFNTAAEAGRRAEEEKRAAAEKARQAALAAADAAKKAAAEEKKRIQQEIDLLEAYDRKKIAAMPVMGDDYEGITEAIQSWPDTYQKLGEEASEAAEKTAALADEMERMTRELREEAGRAFGKAMIAGLRNGMDGVWDALREDLVNTGASMIGDAVGDSVSSSISDALYSAFDSMSLEMADQLGGLFSDVLGGIAGAAVSGLMGSIMGGGDDDAARQIRRQNEELIQSIKENTTSIQRNTAQIDAQIAGNLSSYGGNLFGESESYMKAVSEWKSGKPQYSDFSTGHLGDSWDNYKRFMRAMDAWRQQMPAMAAEYEATLRLLQKNVVDDAEAFFSGIADGFKTAYEKAKAAYDEKAKDLTLGMIDSLSLTENGLGWDFTAGLSKALVQAGEPLKALESLLGALTEGTEAYNNVLMVKNQLYWAGIAQEIKFQNERASIMTDVDTYMADLRGDTSDLDRAIQSVNARFDDWESQLKDAGAAEANLSASRAEAIRITQTLYAETGKLTDELTAQAKAMQSRLTDSILNVTMSSDDYSRHRIGAEYESYVKEIKAMGDGYEYLLTQADAWKRVSIDALDAQIKTTEAQKKAADYSQEASSWGTAADSFTSILDSLEYGDLSQTSTADKMAAIQAELKSIQPASVEDVNRAQELWRMYLEIGKDRYQLPSSEWQRMAAEATEDLVDLQTFAKNKEAELINLTQAQNDILAKVEKWTQDTASNTGGVDHGSSYTYADLPSLKPMYDALAYFQNTKPGDKQSYAGGTLTRLEGDYALFESMQGSYVFNRYDALADIAAQVEAIRKVWETHYGVDISKYTLPGFATGLDYVPQAMPVVVHAREAILNEHEAEAWRQNRYSASGDVITVNFTVNGASKPEETARLARQEIESYLNGRGRKKIQAGARGW